MRSSGKNTVSLGKVTIRVAADMGETAFVELTRKLNVEPMTLPLHDAFERLSDEALQSTLAELEILVPRLAAEPMYATQCLEEECKEPPFRDYNYNGHCYPKGARSVCGNGVTNLAYCSGPSLYAMFRQIFLQGREDDAESKVKEEGEEVEEEKKEEKKKKWEQTTAAMTTTKETKQMRECLT